MSSPNWKNRTVFLGDCLEMMQGMNSDSVDLIYLDPPFNTNKQFQAPIGSPAEGAEFKDFWDWDDIKPYEADALQKGNAVAAQVVRAAMATYNKGMAAYCLMMATRLIQMRRLLKDTGSIYLHCDPTASHYLKILMDAIFGKGNFRNEIVWCYHAGGASKKRFAAKHDVILLYGKDAKKSMHNILRLPYRDAYAYQENHDPEQGVYHPDGKMMHDWWEISLISSVAKERTGYPTQKPLALLDRILKASSNKGDVVLDPFCGCATTLVAAEMLERQYCGIDISPKASSLLKSRLIQATEQGVIGKGIAPLPIILNRPLTRTDNARAMTATEKRAHAKYLYGHQKGKCAGCDYKFEPQHFTLDRIVPKANGGIYAEGNCQLLCSSCNSIKGARSHEYLKLRLKQLGYL